MKKWIPILLFIAFVGFSTNVFAISAAKMAASSDQSLIRGKLTEEDLIDKTFIFSSPLLDFNQKVSTLILLEGGKVQSQDTHVTRWKIGSDNSLKFYLVDELRATFRYEERYKALVAKPFVVGEQAVIRMWLAK